MNKYLDIYLSGNLKYKDVMCKFDDVTNMINPNRSVNTSSTVVVPVERGEKRLSEVQSHEPAKKPRSDSENSATRDISRDTENVHKNEDARARPDNQCFS